MLGEMWKSAFRAQKRERGVRMWAVFEGLGAGRGFGRKVEEGDPMRGDD